MGFKSSAKGSEGTGLNILTTPFLGPVKLKSFERTEINNQEDCAVFTFELEGVDVRDNNVSGLRYQEVVWTPNDSDDESSNQKKVDRIAYIVRKLVPKEKEEEVVAVEGGTWNQYVDNMIAKVEEYKGFERTDLEMKIPGNTWNNKFKVRTPGYLDFITNSEHSPLTWSKGELDENAEYLAGQSSKPTNMESKSELASIDDADF